MSDVLLEPPSTPDKAGEVLPQTSNCLVTVDFAGDAIGTFSARRTHRLRDKSKNDRISASCENCPDVSQSRAF